MRLPDDIWLRAMTHDVVQADARRALLSAEERARYEAMRVEKRRREFLLGRATLRTLLADLLAESPDEIGLRVTDAGSVEVPAAPYHVSLAHSHGRAVAVAGGRRVGVDLERVRACAPRVVDFALHPDERPLLDALPMDRDRAFILYWTLKEAVLKALGTGLKCSPKKVRLEIDAGARRAVAQAWNETTWQAQFEAVDDFVLAVAYEEKGRGKKG